MASRQRVLSATARGDYPVGIPIIPPPGWRPSTAVRHQARESSVAPELVLVLKALLFSLLVIVCMGVGWLLTQGRRPSRTPVTWRQTSRSAEEPGQTGKPAPTQEKGQPSRSAPAEEKGQTGRSAPTEPPRREMTYEKDVLPILERACNSCHGTPRKRGGLDLRTYETLVRGGDNGTGVVPGRPDDSPLYESVATGRMPPGKRKLSAGDKETIRAWIASGARSQRRR